MSEKTLTLEAVRAQFCAADKREVLEKIRETLDEACDIDWAADFTISIGEQMGKALEAEGVTFTPLERLMWAVKEAFILGSLDMATKMMIAADMGIEALVGEVTEHG